MRDGRSKILLFKITGFNSEFDSKEFDHFIFADRVPVPCTCLHV